MTDHDHDAEVAAFGECMTCVRQPPAPPTEPGPVQLGLDGTEARPPVVRNDDPWSSRIGAERGEPRRGTRKYAVLRVLRQNVGRWVDGTDLATPEVGGSEGLRRLRELREYDGWPIERRPHPEQPTSWQYRLPPHSG